MAANHKYGWCDVTDERKVDSEARARGIRVDWPRVVRVAALSAYSQDFSGRLNSVGAQGMIRVEDAALKGRPTTSLGVFSLGSPFRG